MKNSTLNLYSKKYQISSMLDDLKSHSKTYSRLCSTLKSLGSLTGKYEVDIYSVEKDDNDNSIIKAWITDDNGDILVFYLVTPNKDDMLKITKISDSEMTYDALLAKNYVINSDNLTIIKSGNTINNKFGRLVTNSKTFYTLFFGNDMGYQIEGDFSSNLTNDLIDIINKLDKIPTFMELIGILEEYVKTKNINFNYINIIEFKEMNIVKKVLVGEKINAKEKV